MGIFDDIGNFANDVFTGRWAGGGRSGEGAWGDIKADPWVLAAPAAAVAAPFAIGALGAGAAGAGALEAGAVGAGEIGAGELAGGAGSALGFSGEALTGGGAVVTEADPWLAYASAEGTPAAGGGSSIDSLMYGGAGGNLEAPYGAMGVQGGGPMNIAPGSGGGALSSTVTPTREGFLSSLGSDITKHPLQALGVGAAGAGLAYNLMRGNPVGPNEQNVQGQANTLRGQTQELMATGKQLEGYLLNGSLPPGQQAQVNQAVRAAKAAAISNAAKNGQSTDPRTNTQLEQALMDIDLNGVMMASKLEQALFDKGTAMTNQALDATKLSTQMYQWLTAQDKDTQKQVQQALAVFAGALAGGKGGVNLNVGGTKAA